MKRQAAVVSLLTFPVLLLVLSFVRTKLGLPGDSSTWTLMLIGAFSTVVSAAVTKLLDFAVMRAKDGLISALQNKVANPPGCHLHAMAGFFYSRKTMERVFEPMLADMRSEYFDALAKGRIWKARWHRVTYYWAFVKSIGLHSVLSLAQEIVSIFKVIG